MPARFDKRERDERIAKKVDPEKDKPKTQDDEGASVLDALESKVAFEPSGWGNSKDPGRSEWAQPMDPSNPQDAQYIVTHYEQFPPAVATQAQQTLQRMRQPQATDPQMGVRARWEPKVAEASMPPEGDGWQQKPTADPYNPGAYESLVGGDSAHGNVGSEAYKWAVQEGATPEAAAEAARAKEQAALHQGLQGQHPTNMYQVQGKSTTASGQCPNCGGPSSMLGQLGHRVHYRCRNCGFDHSHDYSDQQPGEFDEFADQLADGLMGREHPDDVAAREQDHVEQDPAYWEHYRGSSWVSDSTVERVSHLLS